MNNWPATDTYAHTQEGANRYNSTHASEPATAAGENQAPGFLKTVQYLSPYWMRCLRVLDAGTQDVPVEEIEQSLTREGHETGLDAILMEASYLWNPDTGHCPGYPRGNSR